MRLSGLGRAISAVAMAIGLSGCIDASMEIEVLSQTTAKGVMTVSMDRNIYDANPIAAGASSDFCDDGNLEVSADKVKCIQSEEGDFDALEFGNDDEGERLQIVSAGPGLVRVSFPTKALTGDAGAEMSDNPQAAQMVSAFLAGRTVTLIVSGGEIVESNMDIATDGQSAQMVISLMDLISGNANVPEETFAVVRK